MQKKIVVLSFLLASVVLLSSCRKWDEEEGPTDIRIRNLSTAVFTDIEVNTSGGVNNYGTLNPGATSDYKRFEKAYRIARLTLKADGVQKTYVPIDYTYEVYLGRGKFTYEVWLAANGALEMRVGDDKYPLDD